MRPSCQCKLPCVLLGELMALWENPQWETAASSQPAQPALHFNLFLVSGRLSECDPALQTCLLSFSKIGILIKIHAACSVVVLLAEPKTGKIENSKKRKTIWHGSFGSIKLIFFSRKSYSYSSTVRDMWSVNQVWCNMFFFIIRDIDLIEKTFPDHLLCAKPCMLIRKHKLEKGGDKSLK